MVHFIASPSNSEAIKCTMPVLEIADFEGGEAAVALEAGDGNVLFFHV